MLRPSKKFIVASGVAAGLMASGVAWAAWTADGTGNGYAKADVAKSLTTSPATATADLYPGSTAGDLVVTINNPNPYAVNVTSISNGTGTITSDTTGCTAANSGVSFAGWTGNQSVAANGSVTITLQDKVSMASTSDNACQGATFTIPVALSGASA